MADGLQVRQRPGEDAAVASGKLGRPGKIARAGKREISGK